MTKEIKVKKLREGKTITADELTAELIAKRENDNISVKELLTGDYHDYKLTMLDVAKRLGIARENVNRYVKDQLDRVRINYDMRRDYAIKHEIENCRLQYLFSKKSLNEYIIEAFKIEKKAISIAYSIECDFDEAEMNLLKRLGKKNTWQKKLREACVLYNIENAQGVTVGATSLDDNYDRIAIKIENATLYSMASILSADSDGFEKMNYSQQVYRMLDKVNYLEGHLDITESLTGARKGIRYIFDNSLMERAMLNKNDYLFLSISENTYNLLRFLLYRQHGLDYKYNESNSVEAEKQFKKKLFWAVIDYIQLEEQEESDDSLNDEEI